MTLAVMAIGAGCKKQEPAASPAQGAPTVVAYVAASAAAAMRDVADQFHADGGAEVQVNAEGSNTLAQQILNGAPADVFLSANEKWADAVKAGGREGRRRPLLGNDLVLIVPRDNPAGVTAPRDLTRPGVVHVALAGERVPAGIYAQQALSALDVYAPLTLSGKIVRGEDVTHTLLFVARGEADAGIVYSTDAMASDAVKVVSTFDPKTYDRILYPLVLLKPASPGAGELSGEGNPQAVKFYDYLDTGKAAAIFQKYGFVPIR